MFSDKEVFIILNCKKYNDKRIKQLNSWLPEYVEKTHNTYYHIIGNPSLSDDYKFDLCNNIIEVKCLDDYISLPIKTHLAIKAIYETHPQLEYIFKTDDDMTCDVPAFINELPKIRQAEYGGDRVEITFDHESTYHYPNVPNKYKKPYMMRKSVYCRGRFYFINRRIAEFLSKSRKYFESHVFEDYAVGYPASRLAKNTHYFFCLSMFRDGILS
jgi:hypothetical protein